MPAGAVLLFEDETTLRLFPPLRQAWALKGAQAEVPISGQNAKRVLFGTLNPRTGHRLLLRGQSAGQGGFQTFLRLLRSHYAGRPIWLLLDRAPGHIAESSRRLARSLNVELVWLPKQCSELNAMDQLWKELKGDLAANRQFETIDEAADYAETWILALSPREALKKAGTMSKNYWLKHFLKNFCRPT
jgi:transposase